MSEKTIVNFETKEQTVGMIESKIEKGIDSRNLASMAKSEVGNPPTNLGATKGEYKDLGTGSSNV